MSSLPVIEDLDVFAYGTLGLRASREIPMVNHLRLQASPEAFHRRIVEAVAFTGHRDAELKLLQEVLVLFCTILAPAIRVVDDSLWRTVLLYRSEQSLPGQLRLHPLSHCVTDDLARKDIFDPGQIQPALAGGDVGQIRDPDLVRRARAEILIQQIRRDRKIVTGIGGHLEPAPLAAIQAHGAA